MEAVRVRYFLVVAGLLCAGLASATTALAQSTGEQLLKSSVNDYGPQYSDVDNAIKAFQRGDFAASRRLLHEAKKKHPHLPPADVLQARLFLAANRRAEAMDALELAVAADRDDPEAYILLSDLALRQRQVTLAELALYKAVELVEKFDRNKLRRADMEIRTQAGMATISQLRGLTDKTIEHAKAWAAKEPKSPQPHRLLARAYFQQKKYNDVFAELKKVALLDKNSPQAEVALARMYEEAGFHDVAKQSMEAAVERGADNAKTRLAVALWALAVGETEMAKANADAARKLDADSTDALILQGRIARQQQDQAGAEKLLQEAAVRAPTNFSATNQLALALAASGDQEKLKRALQYAELNLRAHADGNTPAGREAAVTYGWLLFRLGREADAEKAIATAIKAGSISSESAYYVSKIFSARGKPEIAVKILEPVLAMRRAFPQQKDAQALLKELAPASEPKNE
jgi:Flp pilus assembly protein TadD